MPCAGKDLPQRQPGVQESVGLPQIIARKKNTGAHAAPGPGQGPGHGAVKGSDTLGKVFLPGIPTDSWIPISESGCIEIRFQEPLNGVFVFEDFPAADRTLT